MAYGTPGRPLSEPRSPFKVRKAQRAAFQLLKQRAYQSPDAVERRAKNAQHVLVTRARKKLRIMLGGGKESPWTLDQLRRLNLAEIALIAEYSKTRLDSLTPEQQARFKRNAEIFAVAWMTDRMFADLVDFELPKATTRPYREAVSNAARRAPGQQ